MRVCHLNTCPVGVATQDPKLRARFTGDPDHVVNFMRFIAQELREIMAKLGFRTLEEMVGRTDKLIPWKAIEHWKANGLDLTPILHQPEVGPEVGRFRQQDQDHGLEKSLDLTKLLDICQPAIERGEKVQRRAADQQRQPRRRHDHRQRNHQEARAERPARRHDSTQVQRQRRPELRRVHAHAA